MQKIKRSGTKMPSVVTKKVTKNVNLFYLNIFTLVLVSFSKLKMMVSYSKICGMKKSKQNISSL